VVYACGCVLLMLVVTIGHFGRARAAVLNLRTVPLPRPSELMKLAVPDDVAPDLHERPAAACCVVDRTQRAESCAVGS